MTDDNKKVLPKDNGSDYSLPGRLEESNSGNFDLISTNPKSKNRAILVFAVAFCIVAIGFFSFYFVNQSEIDSRIIQNRINVDPERKLVNQYGVGQYGSDHAHAALAIFVEGEQINFGLQQFQVTSKYIHFENHNPYQIHRHATNVPLEILFASIGITITQDCIILNYGETKGIPTGQFCEDKDQSLMFFVNGKGYYSDISQYVLEHNDRILISLGESESIPMQLAYLDSLRIFDVPRETSQYSGNDISV